MTTVFHHIGPYEVIRAIGQGGMAVVFLARDTRNDRQVALKLIQQGTDREAREIVDAERFGAKLQAQFSQVSEHVPAVHEYGVDDKSGYFYVAMEYVDGANLSEVMTPDPLPLQRAVGVAIELCRFLEEAHRFETVVDGRPFRSILHLDLKPRNVRISSNGQVKVLDFGIAKALSLSRKVTRNDFGSVAYLSPERLETGEVDAGADFWALGILLYEMVAGRPPFQAEDTRRLEQLILARRPPAPLTGTCPEGLQAIIAKLLDPVPTARYDSAGAIRDDLERFRSGQPTGAEQGSWPRRAADEGATRRTHVTVAVEDDKTRRTQPSETVVLGGSPREPKAPTATLAATGAARQPRTAGRSLRLLRTVLLLIVFGIVANEIWVAMAAGEAAGTVSGRELDQFASVWSEYDALSSRSYLRIGTIPLERSILERTSVLVDRVIANYRTPSPTVREAQWQMARDSLARTIAAFGSDANLRASLRYCEGHLHRINGEAHKLRREPADAQRELTEAVVAFREAAELRPGWPDPFLGLARTFVYGLEDVDRGADALKQAQQDGHAPSDRETAQLADGYRARGNTLVRNARQLSGLPQELDFLTRAAAAYRQALALYSQASNFANVPANIRLTQRALNQVDDRLSALSPPALSPPATVPDAPVDTDSAAPALPFQSSVRLQDAAP